MGSVGWQGGMKTTLLVCIALCLYYCTGIPRGSQSVRCGRFTRTTRTVSQSSPAWFKANKNSWNCKAKFKMSAHCSTMMVTCGPPGLDQYINCRLGDKLHITRTNAAGHMVSNRYCGYMRPIAARSWGEVIIK